LNNPSAHASTQPKIAGQAITSTTLAQVDASVLTYLPAIVATVQTAEAVASTLPTEQKPTGIDKFNAVMTLVGSGAAAVATTPGASVNVVGIAVLVEIAVQMCKLLGAFAHKHS